MRDLREGVLEEFVSAGQRSGPQREEFEGLYSTIEGDLDRHFRQHEWAPHEYKARDASSRWIRENGHTWALKDAIVDEELVERVACGAAERARAASFLLRAPLPARRVPCARGCGRTTELREGCSRPVLCACARTARAPSPT